MAETLYTINWSPKSERDLQCLDCHYQRVGEAALALLAAGIVAEAQILAAFPEIGRPLPKLGVNWRQLLRKPYRIIYFIEHAFRAVYIARIWHTSRAEPSEEDLIPVR